MTCWTRIGRSARSRNRTRTRRGRNSARAAAEIISWSSACSRRTRKINDLEPGTYVALLSHSGSRGTGAAVCDHYSKIAFSQFPDLPSELKRLAWLSLDSQEGQEYWNAMELMGQYAAANHACIHRHIAEHLGAQVLLDLENHHNFAWKEQHVIDGVEREVIVHRKGATPAGAGVLGIIPGSMATPGFVVSGKGNAESLNSASHGAGRAMSRKAANEKFNWKDVNRFLKRARRDADFRRPRRSADGLQKHPRSHGRAKRFGHGARPV